MFPLIFKSAIAFTTFTACESFHIVESSLFKGIQASELLEHANKLDYNLNFDLNFQAELFFPLRIIGRYLPDYDCKTIKRRIEVDLIIANEKIKNYQKIPMLFLKIAELTLILLLPTQHMINLLTCLCLLNFSKLMSDYISLCYLPEPNDKRAQELLDELDKLKDCLTIKDSILKDNREEAFLDFSSQSELFYNTTSFYMISLTCFFVIPKTTLTVLPLFFLFTNFLCIVKSFQKDLLNTSKLFSKDFRELLTSLLLWEQEQ